MPGDGVGPELMLSVRDVFTAAGVPVDFEEIFIRYAVPIQPFTNIFMNINGLQNEL